MPTKASFRGVEFNVVSHETVIGRRNKLHTPAFEDTGARANDVGRAARVFSFNAVLIGPNYRVQRDKLFDALEQKGPGVLVHPEFGRLLVHAEERIRIRESTTALERVEFDFTFVEAADQQVQRAQFAPLGAVKKQRLTGVAAAEEIFVERFGAAALSDFLDASRLDTLDNVLSDLRSINGAISSVLAVPSGYAAQIDSLASNAALLLATPRRLFQSITAVMDTMAQALTRILGPAGLEGNANATVSFFGYNSRTSEGMSSLRVAATSAALLGSDTTPVPDIDTPERQTQRAEQNTILSTMRASMLLSLADVVSDMPLDSAKDVAAVRSSLVQGMINVAHADATDVALSDALRGAAAGLSKHLRDIESEFTTYTPGTPLPAEVIAHLLYNDPERADEIVQRNRPADPGACPGFQPLEVRRD